MPGYKRVISLGVECLRVPSVFGVLSVVSLGVPSVFAVRIPGKVSFWVIGKVFF